MSREYTFSFLRNQSREFIHLFFCYLYPIQNIITVIIFSIIFYISNIINLIPTSPANSQPIDTVSINTHSLPILSLYKPILHLIETSTSFTISNNTTPTNNSCLSNPPPSKPCHSNLFSNPGNQIQNMITLIIFSFIFYISNVVHLFSTIAEPLANFQYSDYVSIDPRLLSILFLYKSILQFLCASFTISNSPSIIHSRFIYKFIFTLSSALRLFVIYQAYLFIFYQALHVCLCAFSHIVSQIYIFLHHCEPIHIYIYSNSKDNNRSDNSTSSYRFIIILQIMMIMFIIPSIPTNNNCVSILEISSSMNDIVYDTNKIKQLIAKEFIYERFKLVNKYDKFYLPTFNDTFNFQIPLDDRIIQHPHSLPIFTLIQIDIISTPSLTIIPISNTLPNAQIPSQSNVQSPRLPKIQLPRQPPIVKFEISIFSLIFSNAIMRLFIMELLQQINHILSRGVLF